MTTVTSIFADLMARAAGDTLRGLRGAQAAAKIATLPTDRLLHLWPEERPKRELYGLAVEDARQREAAAIKGILAERVDEGKPTHDLSFPAVGPAVEAVVRGFIEANRDEYGLQDIPGRGQVSAANVLEANHERLNQLRSELERRYRTEGEPEALRDLRRELSRAIAAEWAARRTHDEARKVHGGCRLPETESAAVEAAKVADQAAAEVTRIKRALWDRFAVAVQ